jgi:hypothetical protein
MIDSIHSQIEFQRNQLKQYEQLDTSLLHAKPASGGWSILECIGHMNLATELYLDQIEAKLPLLKEGDRAYKPTVLAKYFINGLGVQKDGKIKFRMKTMKAFDPSATGVPDDNGIERLYDNLKRVSKILYQLEGKDLRSFKVTTALGPVLKFNVGDAIRFISAHNERHLLQLQRIYKNVAESSDERSSAITAEMSRSPE